jgi:hypothetical protein
MTPPSLGVIGPNKENNQTNNVSDRDKVLTCSATINSNIYDTSLSLTNFILFMCNGYVSQVMVWYQLSTWEFVSEYADPRYYFNMTKFNKDLSILANMAVQNCSGTLVDF